MIKEQHVTLPLAKRLLASMAFLHFQIYCTAQNLLFAIIQTYLGSAISNASPLLFSFGCCHQVNLLHLNAALLFITAFFHAIYACSQLSFCGDQVISLRLRHLEFLLTMPIMIWTIALLVHATQPWVLALIIILQSLTTTMSYLENANVSIIPRISLSTIVIGSIAYSLQWAIILTFYFRNLRTKTFVVPGYTSAIILVTLFISLGFGLNQLYFVTFARCHNVEIDKLSKLEMDGVFHLLSLSTKSILVWAPVIVIGIN